MGTGIHGLTKVLDGWLEFFKRSSVQNLISSTTEVAKAASELSGQITKSGAVDSLNNALKNISSFADLFRFSETTQGLIRYSAYAGMIYTVIAPVVNVARETYQIKNENEFKKELMKKLDLLPMISMQNMRFSAGIYLVDYKKSCLTHNEIKEDPRLNSLAKEAEHIVDNAPIFDMNLLKPLASELLLALYAEVGVEPFDRITSDISGDILEAAIFQKPMPSHDPSLHNFALVKKLYGAEKINELIKKLCQALSKEGGNSIYSQICYENKSQSQTQFFFQIMSSMLKSYQKNNKTCEYDSKDFVQFYIQLPKRREDIINALSDDGQIKEEVIAVIFNRAFLEYCMKTASYFCFPWNFFEKIKLDLFRASSSTADYPIVMPIDLPDFDSLSHQVDHVSEEENAIYLNSYSRDHSKKEKKEGKKEEKKEKREKKKIDREEEISFGKQPFVKQLN